MYASHAWVTWFSVKKWTQRSSNNIITERYLVCSCEGKTHHAPVAPDEGNTVSKKTKLIPTTRSDCKAKVRLKLDRESGLYYVKQHITLHMHELTRIEWQHLHRSERHNSILDKIETIKAFEDANIKPTTTYQYLSKDMNYSRIRIGIVYFINWL